ncbi:MaoC family dehydratase N-terminal domain-containing protein [Caballeronia sp. LP006]|uniref:FAS1-like dehydratase domain-containing protein n=1 Tax=Caballeronia sp. LP006 TaxID=3038552 RepID=UPI0028571663|nr:MaoC family dehydratase N-terminal domain-containing protein [Caballeronia sp. LP006]MDR5826283.1 MaoC family dehydratase N-terminal domain-containing protein [Caballeronia sp. LP006]
MPLFTGLIKSAHENWYRPTQVHPVVGFVVKMDLQLMKVSDSLRGAKTETFNVLVDASAVQQFCRAIRHDLVYHSSDSDVSQLVVPATFPMIFHAPTTPTWLVGLGEGALLARQQTFEYRRPLRCGESLSCYLTLVNVEETVTKRGPAQLLVQELRAFDESEEQVVTNQRVFIFIPLASVTV